MGLWQDVRFAARLLLKERWFAAAAGVALALGIAVNATVFTLVNADRSAASPSRTLTPSWRSAPGTPRAVSAASHWPTSRTGARPNRSRACRSGATTAST